MHPDPSQVQHPSRAAFRVLICPALPTNQTCIVVWTHDRNALQLVLLAGHMYASYALTRQITVQNTEVNTSTVNDDCGQISDAVEPINLKSDANPPGKVQELAL
jgi:hypothetical protein